MPRAHFVAAPVDACEPNTPASHLQAPPEIDALREPQLAAMPPEPQARLGKKTSATDSQGTFIIHHDLS